MSNQTNKVSLKLQCIHGLYICGNSHLPTGKSVLEKPSHKQKNVFPDNKFRRVWVARSTYWQSMGQPVNRLSRAARHNNLRPTIKLEVIKPSTAYFFSKIFEYYTDISTVYIFSNFGFTVTNNTLPITQNIIPWHRSSSLIRAGW